MRRARSTPQLPVSSTISSSPSNSSSGPDYVRCRNGDLEIRLEDCPEYVSAEEQAEADAAAAFERSELTRRAQEERDRLGVTFFPEAVHEDPAVRAEAERYWNDRARSEVAAAQFKQNLARLEAGNCQAVGDGPALDAVRKARLNWISSEDDFTRRDLAFAYLNAKQYDAALSAFNEAIAKRYDGGLVFGRAQTLANMGRLKQAFADLDRVMPAADVAWSRELLQGRAAVAQGDYAAAIAHLEKIVEISPDYSDPLELAEAYWLAGRRADAIAKADEAIRGGPAETARVRTEEWNERVARFCPAP